MHYVFKICFSYSEAKRHEKASVLFTASNYIKIYGFVAQLYGFKTKMQLFELPTNNVKIFLCADKRTKNEKYK